MDISTNRKAQPPATQWQRLTHMESGHRQSNDIIYTELAKRQLRHAVQHTVRDPNRGVGFNSILERMLGSYPADLAGLLKKEQIPFFIEPADQSTDRSTNVRGWHTLAKEAHLPPPHRVNYEWRFTEDSAGAIVDYIQSLNNTPQKNICCLGTPTIALELIRRNLAGRTTVLDINAPAIHAIGLAFHNDVAECTVYDVQGSLPSRLKKQFDIVVIDPPWYLDYYRVFLSRAVELLTEGGMVVFTLFQQLARHTAAADLYTILQDIATMGGDSLSRIDKVRFESPAFEKCSLEAAGAPVPRFDWRQAELFSSRFSGAKQPLVTGTYTIDDQPWHRIANGDTYIAVSETALNGAFRQNAGLEVSSSEMVFADMGILATISRRELNAVNVDIWDDKNRAYRALSPQVLRLA